MKAKDVRVGGHYYCNISNRKVIVRIIGPSFNGGWRALNMATGRTVYLKSARRLQGKAI